MISKLPPAPSKSDPVNFNAKAEAFLVALQKMVDEINSMANTNTFNLGFATKDQGKKADDALPASSYTAQDVLAKLLAVDGDSSGLDADLLDGHHAASFLMNGEISYLTRSGHNSFAVVIDGKLYSTCGANTSYNNSTTGRGLNGVITQYGLKNLHRVNFENYDYIDYRVVKTGGYCGSFAYALMENGDLYTWGENNSGQCGLGRTNPVALPTLAAQGVVDVFDHPSNSSYSVANNRLFIKKDDGFIYGSGYNVNGALGVGDVVNKSVFTKIQSLGSDVPVFFNLGATYGCAVAQTGDGSIWVAGYNASGQLGTGDKTNKNTFLNVTQNWLNGASMTLKQASGGFGTYDGTTASGVSNLCMLFDDGLSTLLKTAGDNTAGSVGTGVLGGTYTTPQTPNIGDGYVSEIAVSGGGSSTVLALKDNGDLFVFGRNSEGQCGIGSTTNIGTPTVSLNNVQKLFCDGLSSNTNSIHANTVTKDQSGLTVIGYGANYGLGNGMTTNLTTRTNRVVLPFGFDVVDVGSFTTAGGGRIYVAKSSDNRLYAWGYNANNGIDQATTGNVLIPVSIEQPRG